MTTNLSYGIGSGLRQWRRRAVSRRQRLRVLVRGNSPALGPARPAKRQHLLPIPAAVCPAVVGIRVGEFLVGEKGDRRILGHPDIRY